MAILVLFMLLCMSITRGQPVDVDSTCPNGEEPIDCGGFPDTCANTTCTHHPDAPCKLDPCNACSPLFYDEETDTKLKCNGEYLQCALCFKQDGTTCGGPGVSAPFQECVPYQVCGAFEVTFIFGTALVPVFYRGCVPSDALDAGGPSCYSNDTLKEHLRVIFNNADELVEGYGCVCTEDYCNNFDLETYENEEINSCIDELGIWFNPGDFRFDSDCDTSFCDSSGTFACRFEVEELPCEFEDFSFAHGESFRSGFGDCICNDGDITCTTGVRNSLTDLACYTVEGLLKPDIGGIEICDEGSVCVVGYTVSHLPSFDIPFYSKECVGSELLDFDGDCTTSFEDVLNYLPVDSSTSVEICKCNTSYCNGDSPQSSSDGASCFFDGRTYGHNEELIRDECNVCNCYDGQMFCTDYACNGLLCFECYESSIDGFNECGKAVCHEGEVCVSASFMYPGFVAFNGFLQGCVDSQDIQLDECVTGVDMGVHLGLIDQFQADFFSPSVQLALCNESLCNTANSFRDACFSGTESPRTSPPKVCYDKEDPTTVYNEGEEAVFSCEICTCLGHLDFGQWSCIRICTESPKGSTTPRIQGDCSFGSHYPKYYEGEVFTSGCGTCSCTDAEIICQKGECPALSCVVGHGTSDDHTEFCEEDSYCLTKESLFYSPITVVERSCLATSDWPYNTTMTQDPSFFGDSPGEALVCSENLCNAQGYTQALPEVCEYESNQYAHKEEFWPDECNLCVCLSGSVHCTREPCNGPICFSHHEEGSFFQWEAFNITCLYDEVCISVTDVTFVTGGRGQHGECASKSTTGLPPPGQCTTDPAIIEDMFSEQVASGTLCTIVDQTEIQSTMNPTTPTLTAETTTCVTENKRESYVINDTISTDSCYCICQRGINKKPDLSCNCEFNITIIFKEEFSTIEGSLDEFKRLIIDGLSKDLGVPKKNIISVEVYPGSIIVDASIISDTLDTEEKLQMVVNDGSFTIIHEGVRLRADSIKVIGGDEQSTPGPKPTFFWVVISIVVVVCVFAVIVVAVAVLSVTRRKEDSDFVAFRGNYPQRRSEDSQPMTSPSTHYYATPPIEYEPEDKDLQQEDSKGVSNTYQSSLDLALESSGDYHKSIDFNESVVHSDYQKSIDFDDQLDDTNDIHNPAYMPE